MNPRRLHRDTMSSSFVSFAIPYGLHRFRVNPDYIGDRRDYKVPGLEAGERRRRVTFGGTGPLADGQAIAVEIGTLQSVSGEPYPCCAQQQEDAAPQHVSHGRSAASILKEAQRGNMDLRHAHHQWLAPITITAAPRRPTLRRNGDVDPVTRRHWSFDSASKLA